MPSAGQVVHGGVVIGIASDEDGIQIFRLHESFKVGFHFWFLQVKIQREKTHILTFVFSPPGEIGFVPRQSLSRKPLAYL